MYIHLIYFQIFPISKIINFSENKPAAKAKKTVQKKSANGIVFTY